MASPRSEEVLQGVSELKARVGAAALRSQARSQEHEIELQDARQRGLVRARQKVANLLLAWDPPQHGPPGAASPRT
ncbi:hypothetical protein DIPPA_24102 [Diplonema papillatum]|nr:hypothetical protein DIPPA_24102 [Diplonema papillatum]